MVRVENIQNKISYLRTILKKVARYKALPLSEIFSNSDTTAALERYLFLAAQAAIDSIEMFCKLEKLGRPESMSDAIRILSKNDIITSEFADKMIRMVGFRNYLSHGYEHIDQKVVGEVLHQHLDDLETLALILESAYGSSTKAPKR